MEISRVAIVGLGSMGVRHVAAARQAGMQVIAVCDSDEQRLEWAVREHALTDAEPHVRLESLLGNFQVDALVIATNSDIRPQIVSAASDAGIGLILAEKPLARSISAAIRCNEVCRANGTKLVVNHQAVVTSKFRWIANLVDSSDFGSLRSWVVAAGDIGLAMGCSHLVSQFVRLVGESNFSVEFHMHNRQNPNPRGPQYLDPSGVLKVESAQGRRLIADFSGDQGHGIRSIYSGGYGQLAMDELTGRGLLDVRNESDRSLPMTRYGSGSKVQEVHLEVPDTVPATAMVWKSILDDDGLAVTGDEAEICMRILVAAWQSGSAGGKRLDINSVSDSAPLPLWP